MLGFVSYKDFSATDGESLALVEFADAACLLDWRDHPEHQVMMQRGRDEFLREYRVQIFGKPEREYSFKLP